jgi:hypothetical protein
MQNHCTVSSPHDTLAWREHRGYLAHCSTCSPIDSIASMNSATQCSADLLELPVVPSCSVPQVPDGSHRPFGCRNPVRALCNLCRKHRCHGKPVLEAGHWQRQAPRAAPGALHVCSRRPCVVCSRRITATPSMRACGMAHPLKPCGSGNVAPDSEYRASV